MDLPAATDPERAAPAPLAPVAAAERIQALDVVRGFALLGIFLMNVEFFARPLQDIGGDSIDPAMHGLDYLADAAIFVLVQNKFWVLFSLLFGMGFAVMIERARRAGRAFVPAYLRRSLALLAIGAVHTLLIWAGDILVMYAIAALLLLLGRSVYRAARQEATGETPPLRPGTLAAFGLAAYALPMFMALAMGISGSLDAMNPPDARETARMQDDAARDHEAAAQERARAERRYAHGTYADAVRQRAADTAEELQPLSLAFFLPSVLGAFLLGAAILRSGVMERPQAFRPQLRWARGAGLLLGFGVMATSVWLGTNMDFGHFNLRNALQVDTYMVAGLVLAVAYGATLLLALDGPVGGPLRRWLGPAGRMALTNYLLQSLIGTLTFYGYGLGLWGRVGRAEQVGFVAVVFALQLLASRWWLARFRFGPAEWLWRAATYGHWPAMRQGASA